MEDTSLYRARSLGVIRVAALPKARMTPTASGLGLDEHANAEAIKREIRSVADDAMVFDAIEVSSPSLAMAIYKVATGHEVGFAELRRTMLAVTRYILRMSCRPTPFGLMSGMGVMKVGANEESRPWTACVPSKVVRPDHRWLTRVCRSLEREEGVLQSLTVVANDYAAINGDRLTCAVTGHTEIDKPEHGPQNMDADFASVRYSRAVALIWEFTQQPVRVSDVLARLVSVYGVEREEKCLEVVKRLVWHKFLITNLDPPLDSSEPLTHLVDVLESLPPANAVRPKIIEVRETLRGYAARPIGAGGFRVAVPGMPAEWQRSGEPLVHVDLINAVDVQLPEAVGVEAERAATELYRVAASRRSDRHLDVYHQEVLEKYGEGSFIRAQELLDEVVGLGPPASYTSPTGPRGGSSSADSGQDEASRLLIEAAYGAFAAGVTEVEIGDLLSEPVSSMPVTSPLVSCDFGAQLFSHSVEHLRAGSFTLLAEGAISNLAGAVAGRFSGWSTDLTEYARIGYDALAGGRVQSGDQDYSSVVPVQLYFDPWRRRVRNVAQVPRFTEYALSLGGSVTSTGQVLPLSDILVAADRDRLFLVSESLGRRVIVMPPHMLNVRTVAPNVVRFLVEVSMFHESNCWGWDWRGASILPFLPRVRAGRTVFSRALWSVPASLRDKRKSEQEWTEALDRWRRDYRVPSNLEARAGDNYIQLDLNSRLHRSVLRSEIGRRRRLQLVEVLEDEAGRGLGWNGGYAHELSFAMVPAAQADAADVTCRGGAKRARAWFRTAAAEEARCLKYEPGSECLYASVYVPESELSNVIIDHLPWLVAEARSRVSLDRWFFMRYFDPFPHLRIRMFGKSSADYCVLLDVLRLWMTRLRQSGLSEDFSVHTYHPEISRYGGAEQMLLAERVFEADSEAVIEQLGLLRSGAWEVDPVVACSLNIIDISMYLWSWRVAEALEEVVSKDSAAHRDTRKERSLAAQYWLSRDGSSWCEFAGGSTAELVHARRLSLEKYVNALTVGGGVEGQGTARASVAVLHMHHNRLIGADQEGEFRALAIAASVTRAAAFGGFRRSKHPD